jgi:hypothetical protein
MPAVHEIFNNAYILFSLALGSWCVIKLLKREGLDGQFWGAVAVNTLLALATLLFSVVMVLVGYRARRWVYYLYGLYFVVVLPGTYSLLRGRDDRMATTIYGIVTFFNAAAATRVPILTLPWIES